MQQTLYLTKKMKHNHIPLTSQQYKRLVDNWFIEESNLSIHINAFGVYCKSKLIDPTDKQKRIVNAIFRNAGYRVDNWKIYKSGNYRIA